jgi:DNA-binding beta-propeller fold protein YncE
MGTLNALLLAGALAAPADSSSGTRVSAPPDTLAYALALEATIAPPGDGVGHVIEPSGVATDAFGRVWTSDAALHRLQWLEPGGRFLGQAGTLGSDPGQLRQPGSIVRLGSLGVAVLDVENRRIVTYDLLGRLVGVLVDLEDPAVASATGRVDPVALAADRGGAMVVADRERERLVAFDFAGRYLRSLGGIGSRPGSFRGLAGIAATPRGELITTERGNARVQRLDASGRPLTAWPLDVGSRRGALPVAVDDSSRVAVADEGAGALWVFDGQGHPIAARRGLDRPRALAFTPDGALLVAEAGGSRVTRWRLRPRSADRGD